MKNILKIIFFMIYISTCSAKNIKDEDFAIVHCGDSARCIGERCIMLNSNADYFFITNTYPLATKNNLKLFNVLISKNSISEKYFKRVFCIYKENDYFVEFRGEVEVIEESAPRIVPEGEGWEKLRHENSFTCDPSVSKCEFKVS